MAGGWLGVAGKRLSVLKMSGCLPFLCLPSLIPDPTPYLLCQCQCDAPHFTAQPLSKPWPWPPSVPQGPM